MDILLTVLMMLGVIFISGVIFFFVTSLQNGKGKGFKTVLSKEEALDMVKTIIGLNYTTLKACDDILFVPLRNDIAKKIIDSLTDKELKRFYYEQH